MVASAELYHRRADLSIRPKSERFKSFLAEKKGVKYDKRPCSLGKQSSSTSLDNLSETKGPKVAEIATREATEQALKEIMPFTHEDRKAFMVSLASKLSCDVSKQKEEGVAAIEGILSDLIARNRNEADARDSAEDDATSTSAIEEAICDVLSEQSPAFQESLHSDQSPLSISQRLAKASRYTQFKEDRRSSIDFVTASQSSRSSIGFVTASQSTTRFSNFKEQPHSTIDLSVGLQNAGSTKYGSRSESRSEARSEARSDNNSSRNSRRVSFSDNFVCINQEEDEFRESVSYASESTVDVATFAHKDSFQYGMEKHEQTMVKESYADSKVSMAQINTTFAESENMGFSDRTVLRQGGQRTVLAKSENMGKLDSQKMSKSDLTALSMEGRPSSGDNSGNSSRSKVAASVMNVLAAIVFGDELAVKADKVIPPVTSIDMENSFTGDQSELSFLQSVQQKD